MKILAIGNSFSEDATYYLQKIAHSAGKEMTVVNLYIGGCSLKTHRENLNNPAYRYELNGIVTDRTVSVVDTLQREKWDIVTVQQQSAQVGVYETFGEDFEAVLDCIRTYAPGAKIYFHQTWAYEIGGRLDTYALFDYDQEIMYNAIHQTVEQVCREHENMPIIPCGDVIQKVRQKPLFHVPTGGQTLCRDGYHMHLVYGRYLLGLVWFCILLEGQVEDVTFVPAPEDMVNGYSMDLYDCDPEKIRVIRQTVAEHFNTL